ncbi:MAG: beta-glucuronidase, partial [Bacteroidaceae bacterium]|nr:beta-glucuronidase [Bacteroidaceae bacterium]
MKRIVAFVLLMAALCVQMSANEVNLIGNVPARKAMSLNGDWNYIIDVQEEGYYDYRMNVTQWGFFQNAKPQRPEDLVEYDFDKSPTMKIPGDWNTQDDRLFFYEGTVWFYKKFKVDSSELREGIRKLLYFGAVNYEAIVYVNGRREGRHVGGFTPFCFDVTDRLKAGENVVIVKVDNKRNVSNIPTVIFDWWNYGGITRDVLLLEVPTVYIENYKIELAKADAKAKQRDILVSVQLNQQKAGETITLSIPELKLKQTLTTDAEGKAATTLKVSSKTLSLWSPQNPKLYKVDLTIGDETLTDEIGFRTIETRGKQILLNGQPIFLKG